MFDSLKSLGNKGPKVAPVATPAPAAEPTQAPVANAASVQSLHADPYQDLKRFSDPKIKPVVIPAPSVAAPKTVPTEQPAAVALPAGIIPLTDPAGVVRGYLNRDGAFVLATLEKSNTSLDHLSEHDRRPVDPEEELRVDLPQRSHGRIEFLLATYEAGRMDLTQARILNDHNRHLNESNGALRVNPQSRQLNPESVTPSVAMFHQQ